MISVLLVFAMLASITPVQVFAEEGQSSAADTTVSTMSADEEAARKAAEEAAAAEAAQKAAEEAAAAEAAQKAAEEAAAAEAAQKAAEEAAAAEAAQKAAEEAAAAEAAQKAAEEAAAAEAAQKAAEEAAAAEAAQKAAEEAAAAEAAQKEAGETAGAVAEGENATEAPVVEEVPATEEPSVEGTPVEETPVEEEPVVEEPVTVESVSAQVGNVTATVNATLPAEAELNIAETELTVEQQTLIADAIGADNEIVEMQVWDIALTGAEIEGSVPVTITGIQLEAGEGTYVAHIKADNTLETGSYENGAATVSVTSFSPFVVASYKAVEEVEPTPTPTVQVPSARASLPLTLDLYADSNDASTRASDSTQYINVGQTITVTGTSGRDHNWYTTNSSSGDANKYVSVSSDEGSASVTGLNAGKTTLVHSYRSGWSLRTETETFEIVVSEAPGTIVKAYFYAVRPDQSAASTGNESFFYVGEGKLNVSGLSLSNGENTTSIGDRVVTAPSETVAKERIAKIYGVNEDEVAISYTYYKISHVNGAPGFNENNPNATGSDMVEGAFCYHVDMNVNITTKKKATYYFYLLDAGASDFGPAVRYGQVDLGTTVTPPSYEPQKIVNGETYVFDGWYTDRAFRNKATATDFTINEASAFYARYEKQKATYTVTYAPGTTDKVTNMPAKGTVTEGDTYTISNTVPDRDGYKFTGWLGSDGKTYQAGGEIGNVTGNITLTAQWEPKNNATIDVIFKCGDEEVGSEQLTGQTVGNSVTVKVGDGDGEIAIPDGYKLAEDEQAEKTVQVEPSGNEVIFRVVVDDAQTYVVRYLTDGNGTAVPTNQSAQVLGTSGITGSEATANPGYKFVGWYKGEDLTRC